MARNFRSFGVAMDAAPDDTTPDASSTQPRSLADYERDALARMSPEALAYIEGGAGDEVTLSTTWPRGGAGRWRRGCSSARAALTPA